MRCAGSFAMMLECFCVSFISMGQASLPYSDLRRPCSPFSQRHFPGRRVAKTLPGSWSSVCSQTAPRVRLPPLPQAGRTVGSILLRFETRDEKRQLRLQRQLAGYKLLIVDDLGYVIGASPWWFVPPADTSPASRVAIFDAHATISRTGCSYSCGATRRSPRMAPGVRIRPSPASRRGLPVLFAKRFMLPKALAGVRGPP